MACSEARIEANRRNAQLSTGPKTEAGKAASRGNALKDGLTGEGVVLPAPLKADFEFEYARWCELYPPANVEDEALLKTLALAQARILPLRDEQVRLEEANREHDLECGAIERTAAVQHWYRRIASNPALAIAEIQRTSTGCRWLAERWEAFEFGLEDGGCLWTDDDLKRLLDLAGIPHDERHLSKKARDFESLYKRARTGDTTAHADLLERVADYRRKLINEAVRLESGHEAYLRESLESGRRVDLSPAMMRLRRLEAANLRTVQRCLELLHKLRATAPAAAPPPPPRPPEMSTDLLRELTSRRSDPGVSVGEDIERWMKARGLALTSTPPAMGEVHLDITAAAPGSSG